MNKIKKQFKDFISYYKLCKYGANISEEETVISYIPVILCIIASMTSMLMQFYVKTYIEGYVSLSFEVIFIVCASGAAMNIGMVTRPKSSLISVAPFTPKQRIVFSYLAALVKAVVLFVLSFAAILLAVFIGGCIFSVVEGSFVFGGDMSGCVDYTSRYTPVFYFLSCVIFFFAYFAICNINRAKYRNIAAVCFAVGMIILSTVLVNVYEHGAKLITEINYCLDGLKYPWIVFVVQSVLAVGAIVASVFATIKRFKSSKI